MKLLPLVLLLALTGCGGTAPADPPPTSAPSSAATSPGATLVPSPTKAPRPRLPLRGVVIALDPGHQLGNHNFPAQTARLVDAGGLTKPCNTTGTATVDGWAEATFAWELARLVAGRLEELGARVELTRRSNSEQHWGPCVDTRGRFAGKVGADLLVSLHADGTDAGERGFHVIAAPDRPRALRLARALRAGLVEAGLPRSSYVADGLTIRPDLGTLNLADVPAAMLESGNMMNPDDAALMRSDSGRARYADGIVAGIRSFLKR